MPQRKKRTDELRRHGTYRSDRHDTGATPGNLLGSLPKPPFKLSEAAEKIYFQEGKKLVQMQLLMDSDLHTLAQYASEAATYIRCMEEVNAGELVVELHNKVTAPHPARKIAENALKNMMALSDRLGLSPKSRFALQGEAAFSGDKNDDDPIMKILYGN